MKLDLLRYNQALKVLPNLKIAVVGDMILDEYLIGQVERISPEAPVPVVDVQEQNITLGGSGNVIKNLHAIGIESIVFARIGDDENAEILKEKLSKKGVTEKSLYLVCQPGIPTTIKTRIIAGQQQICRVDKEDRRPITGIQQRQIVQNFEQIIDSTDGTILSDYDKGYLTPGLIRELINISRQKQKFIAVDPQVSHFFQYERASILTPNHHEAGNALKKKIYSDAEFETAAQDISWRLQTEYMMITRGEKGMTLYSRNNDEYYHIPTLAREVFDVTGAGDTVITLFTAFYLAGLNALEACLVANAGAGLVVEKLGSCTVTCEELTEQIHTMGLL